LKISAEQCEEVKNVLMKDLDVEKAELDELWTYVKKNISENGLLVRK
jgi:hypothetical protein